MQHAFKHLSAMTRSVRAALLVLALSFLSACGTDIVSVELGGVSLSVSSRASVATVSSWRATISGASVSQTRTGSPGGTIEFTEVPAGSYSVLLEGFDGSDLASRGQTNVTVQAGSNATATVALSPVLPQLSVVASDPNASEIGPDAGTFTISRSGPSSSALLINYSLSGTATAGADYQTSVSAVTMGAGQRSVAVAVVPLLDAVQEGNETIILTLNAGTDYVVGAPSSGTVVIADAPLPTVTVSALDADASEVGPNTGTFRITRTGATSTSLAVGVALGGSAVNGTDYQAIATTHTIAVGATFVDVSVAPLLDALVEGSEQVLLTVLNGSGYALGTPASAAITIADAPVVTIAATDFNASEVGPDPGTFTISRTGPSTNALTVSFAVSGTATMGSDYSGIATTLVLPVGADSRTVTISPIADALSEGSESVVLTLSASANYAIGTPNSATVTIADTPAPILPACEAPVTIDLPDERFLLVGQTTTVQAPTLVNLRAGAVITTSYVSSASTVAPVSPGGVVTALSAGQAIIQATATCSGPTYSSVSKSRSTIVSVAAELGVGFGAEQFAPIPGGSFVMGTPSGGNADERPIRTVTISPFRMQRTEVTQAQWRQVMAGTNIANPSVFASCGDRCPVEAVRWNDVQTFLDRLNQLDPGKNYRLPTEAEWEYATRAGTTGDYSGSGFLNEIAWWSGNSGGVTRVVAQKPANGFGLFDVHGNVWEWVNDWYALYPNGNVSDPTGPPSGTERVARGGSFESDALANRSAHRARSLPSLAYRNVGFRLARNP